MYSIKEDFIVEHARVLHKGPKGNSPFVFASSFFYSALTSIAHNDFVSTPPPSLTCIAFKTKPQNIMWWPTKTSKNINKDYKILWEILTKDKKSYS